MKQLLVALAVLVSVVKSIEFSIELDYYSRSCFKEFITENTPFRFQVSASTSPKFEFSVSLKDGHILTKNPQGSSYTKRFDHFAPISSNYIFCIQNLANKQSFNIVYLSRIQLSDINQLPKQEESKRIQKLVEMVNNAYTEIRQKQQYSITVNEYNMELQKLVSFKSVGFGFLSITVVLVISFMHYLEIKRVLKNRKII